MENPVKLPCVEMPNGMYLTRSERTIMLLLIREAKNRTVIFGQTSTHFDELSKMHALMGDYIAAYKGGFIKESDFERCG